MARKSGSGKKTVVRTPYTSAFKMGGYGSSKRTSKRSNGKSR